MEYKGIISLLFAAFIWSTFGALSRVVGYDIPVMYQNVTRNALAALIIGVIVYVTKSWKKVESKFYPILIIRTIGGIFGFLFFFLAANKIPIGLLYFLFYGATTLLTFILGYKIFNEKITPVRLLALGLAMFGLALVYKISAGNYAFKDLIYPMLAGLGFATWSMSGKKLSDHFGPHQLIFIDEVLTTVAYIILSLIFREVWTAPLFTITWGVSLLFGVLYIFTALLSLYGFRKVDAQIGGLVLLSEILFAIVIGFVFYGELITPVTLIGGICIILAMAIPEIRWKKFSQK